MRMVEYFREGSVVILKGLCKDECYERKVKVSYLNFAGFCGAGFKSRVSA